MKESGLLPVVGRLLKSYNFGFQPRSHALDLVQALHIILRLLDRLNASGMHAFLLHAALGKSSFSHTWKSSCCRQMVVGHPKVYY